MNTMFVVTKEWVYLHDIMGIYSHYPAALERARFCILAEGDDYHKFEIMECDVNRPIIDGKLVAIVSRKDSKDNGQPHLDVVER